MEEEIHSDDTLPLIYDYNDGCASFTPTIANEIDYAYVESNDTFMHVDHDKNDLCDSYIVELFMMPLKIVLKEESMVIEIFMLLNFFSL